MDWICFENSILQIMFILSKKASFRRAGISECMEDNYETSINIFRGHRG